MPLDLKPIEDTIREFLEDQPYDISCAVCSLPLEVETTIDRELDMTVSVSPCDTCLSEAKKESEA